MCFRCKQLLIFESMLVLLNFFLQFVAVICLDRQSKHFFQKNKVVGNDRRNRLFNPSHPVAGQSQRSPIDSCTKCTTQMHSTQLWNRVSDDNEVDGTEGNVQFLLFTRNVRRVKIPLQRMNCAPKLNLKLLFLIYILAMLQLRG